MKSLAVAQPGECDPEALASRRDLLEQMPDAVHDPERGQILGRGIIEF